MKALVAFVGFAILQAWFMPALQSRGPARVEGAGALSDRLPGAAGAVLLGGFQPLVVQALWNDAELASRDRRWLDVLQDFRLLARIDPDNVVARLYMARILAIDLADRMPTPGQRLARILEAVELLESTARRLPADPRLPDAHGQILLGAWTWDPDLARTFERRRGKSPAREAAETFEAALSLAPGSEALRLSLMRALRRSAWERLTRGEATEAITELRRAGEVVAAITDAPHLRAMAAAWEGVARGLGARRPELLTAGLRALSPRLEEIAPPSEGGPGEEEAMAWSILRPALDLGIEAAGGSTPADALSLLQAVHNIGALLARRLEATDSGRFPDADFEGDLRGALAVVRQREPRLSPAVQALLEAMDRN